MIRSSRTKQNQQVRTKRDRTKSTICSFSRISEESFQREVVDQPRRAETSLENRGNNRPVDFFLEDQQLDRTTVSFADEDSLSFELDHRPVSLDRLSISKSGENDPRLPQLVLRRPQESLPQPNDLSVDLHFDFDSRPDPNLRRTFDL